MSLGGLTNDAASNFGLWYSYLPPVTRFLLSCWVVTAVAGQLQLLPVGLMGISWPMIFGRLQVWRLITNFGYLGGFSPHFAFRLIWLILYSPPLEMLMTKYNAGEFAFLVLFSMIVFDILSLVLPLYFCASPLVFVLLYLWARHNSDQDVSIWGIVRVKAFYLPWAMLGMDLMFGKPMTALLPDLTGIAIGHLHYFLTSLYPRSSGQQILKCPIWLTRALSDQYPQAQAAQPAASRGQRGASNRFHAFHGRGRRLVD